MKPKHLVMSPRSTSLQFLLEKLTDQCSKHWMSQLPSESTRFLLFNTLCSPFICVPFCSRAIIIFDLTANADGTVMPNYCPKCFIKIYPVIIVINSPCSTLFIALFCPKIGRRSIYDISGS